MTYVVGDACVKCKYTDCVAVCPVDCFYEGKNMLVIHPDECIDCGACEPECPSTAIFHETDLPAAQRPYLAINAFFSGAKFREDVDTTGWPAQLLPIKNLGFWPNITDQKAQLPTAEAAKNEANKIGSIDPTPGEGS